MHNSKFNIQNTKLGVTVNLAPVVLFVYNRPWHTQQTVETLLKNELASESEFFVFCDGAKDNATFEDKQNIMEVRNYIRSIKEIRGCFKSVTIYESNNNKGLADSIISGVTEIINRYGKIIILEDDIVTSSSFLKFMNDSLNYYEEYENVYSVSGYNLPLSLTPISNNYKEDVFFLYRSHAWGWGTWKRAWSGIDWTIKDYKLFKIDNKRVKEFYNIGYDLPNMLKMQMEKKIDSWAVRFAYHHFKNKALCLYPVISFVDNIGLDGTGVHCGSNNSRHNAVLNKKKCVEFIAPTIVKSILKRYKFYGQPYLGYKKIFVLFFNLSKRILRKLYKCVKSQ